ncbi:MAG: prepilin peptidase [Puniceicoccales bacterium]|jgi:leader peptidase (prepilin peptidase)/N-methyltransferase|nr:prepilin peptidase [Puniceicoccales bacterium]
MTLLDNLRELALRAPWFPVAAFAALGAAAGSFLNVCAARIPKGESIIRPGSHCECGAPIPWFRNLPVLSWLLLGGRAACCRRRLGARHPLVEGGTALWFALCWAWLPWQQALAGMLFGAWLLALALMDLDTMYLPDAPNIGLVLVGVCVALALPESHGTEIAAGGVFRGGGVGIAAPAPVTGEGVPRLAMILPALADALVGALAGAGLAYWLRLFATVAFRREALGEGDIILLGGIGAFCGWQGAVFALFGGSVLGAAFLAPAVLIEKIRGTAGGKQSPAAAKNASLASCEGDEFAADNAAGGLAQAIPFGPWLAAGAAAWWLFFREPMSAQIETLRALLN